MDKITQNLKSHPLLPRFFSLLTDLIILSICCGALAKILTSYTTFHPFVLNLIGTAYCLIYFAMLNSHISSGKTIGKRLCKIRVDNLANQSIGITHSFIRSAIFILPLCFIGYLKVDAQMSFVWAIVQAILISIVIACIYLAIFNTNSQQGLHDWLTKTQILRNSQTYLQLKPILKYHFYFLSIITIILISSSIFKVSQSEKLNFSTLNPAIQNITLNTHHTYIGEAESVDQILIFDLNSIKNKDEPSISRELLQKFSDQNPNFIKENNVNKTQLNYSYQFGLVQIKHSMTYDIIENYGVTSLIYSGSGQGQSINFGFL